MEYGIQKYFPLLYCLACCWPVTYAAQNSLRIVNQWSTLKFVFPNDTAEQRAVEKRYFIRGASVPIDVDVQYRKGQKTRIFVTIPRFDEGRPVTLGTVDDKGLITGYPDYSWHDNQGQNCDGLTSVFRVAIDKCNRMWVMDAGKIGEQQVCPPQLLAFDLNTDKVVYRHKVPASNYLCTSLFITPVVDLRGQAPGDCSDTFVYVADVSGYALLVVDVRNDRSWRMTHRYFFPYPNHGSFTIDGESFDLMDGVLGMALSPYEPRKERKLYFHALAATTEDLVPASLLRNDSFISNPNADPNSIYEFAGQRPNQAAAEAMDKNGILYFGQMEPPSIWCWNSATEFSPRNFYQIANNRETLQFASGMKIVDNLKGEQELWALTSSFQRVMTGSISADRVNFRIHTEYISTIYENSPCALAPKN